MKMTWMTKKMAIKMTTRTTVTTMTTMTFDDHDVGNADFAHDDDGDR